MIGLISNIWDIGRTKIMITTTLSKVYNNHGCARGRGWGVINSLCTPQYLHTSDMVNFDANK